MWVGQGSGAMTLNEILPGVRKAVASCVALEPSSYLHRFAVMVALSSMVFLCPAALSRVQVPYTGNDFPTLLWSAFCPPGPKVEP